MSTPLSDLTNGLPVLPPSGVAPAAKPSLPVAPGTAQAGLSTFGRLSAGEGNGRPLAGKKKRKKKRKKRKNDGGDKDGREEKEGREEEKKEDEVAR